MTYNGTNGPDIRALGLDTEGFFLGGSDWGIGDFDAETLYGGDGHDVLFGGVNQTFIGTGTAANPIRDLTFLSSTGEDVLFGDAGSDVLYGADGNDTLHGGNGDDSGVHVYFAAPKYYVSGLFGGQGNDKLFGEAGKDDLWGENGDDTLSGGVGNDKLYGGDGKDTLTGGDGADRLDGGRHTDKLSGGLNNDRLIGGGGFDTLTGGGGADKFIFTTFNDAGDTISDFSAADTLQLSGAKFGKLAAGPLAQKYFHKNTTGLAHDDTDRFIYDTNDHKLYYDSNGKVPGGDKTLITTFSNGYALDFDDIAII